MKTAGILMLTLALLAQSATADRPPCCTGACTEAGHEKYWSLAKSISGVKHCGESCMNPKYYGLYHFFEKNLTKSATANPCMEFGYTKYDTTASHGFGPIKMTVDLYNLPSSDVSAPAPALVSLRGSSSSEPRMVALASDDCTMYLDQDTHCDEFVTYCKLGKELGLTEGTCKGQGYTVFNTTIHQTFPLMVDVNVTVYTKPAKMVVLASDDCTLYGVSNGLCDECVLSCQLGKHLGLTEGTCKSQGYTVVKTSITRPGPCVWYTKPAKMVALAVKKQETCLPLNRACDLYKDECCSPYKCGWIEGHCIRDTGIVPVGSGCGFPCKTASDCMLTSGCGFCDDGFCQAQSVMNAAVEARLD